MDELRAYQRRRLALADALRDILNLARAAHDERLEGEARELLARLAGDRFTLVVAGQFSRGKSTLMNAILGGPYLPTGVLPMTSVITTVVYGSRRRATFLRRGSDVAIETPLDRVPELVAQSSGRRAELQVTAVDIQLPAEILRLGFAFVDTPGIGSAIGANSATTRRFLPRADAILFVTGFDSAFTQTEVDLLRQAVRQRTPLFCVVNKRDLVDAREAATVMSAVRSVLADAGAPDAEAFSLSALGGLNAKSRSDVSALAASGLPELESAIQRFLATQKARVFLANVAERTVELAERERRDLSVGVLDGRPAAEVQRLFGDRLRQAVAEQRECEERIRSRVHRQLGSVLGSCRAAWRSDLDRRLSGIVDGFQPPRHDHDLLEQSAVGDALAHQTAGPVREWTSACAAEFAELLVGLVAGDVERLYAAAESLNVFGPALAGRPLPHDGVAGVTWDPAELPRAPVPGLDWSLVIDTTDWRHVGHAAREAQLRRRIRSAIDAAVDEATGRLSSALAELADGWVREVAADAEKRTQAASARFLRHLAAPPSSDDLGALDALVARSERLREEIANASGGTPPFEQPEEQRGRPHGTGQNTERECVVCVAMREELISFMSHSQYALATREHDQARHARGHGFCPTHTWLYHGIASPLGISAGYAAVAEAAARHLDDALTRRGPARPLAEVVDELVVPTRNCPACRTLERAEDREVARLAHRDDAEVPVLCAAHTARVLERSTGPEDARALVRALAANLRRDSEDMRSYALKREARYRWLITDEESRAYRETLRLLAGDALLARAGEGEKDLEFPSETREGGTDGREEAS